MVKTLRLYFLGYWPFDELGERLPRLFCKVALMLLMSVQVFNFAFIGELQRLAFAEFWSTITLSDYAKIKLQLSAATATLYSAFRSKTLAQSVIEAFLGQTKPEFSNLPFSESVFIRKESIHHSGPLMAWAIDFALLLLRNIFFAVCSRGQQHQLSLEHLGNHNVLAYFIFHDSTRKLIMELLILVRYVQLNVSYYLLAVSGINNQNVAQRALVAKLVGTQPLLAEDQIYLSEFEAHANVIKLDVESACSLFYEMGAAFNRLLGQSDTAAANDRLEALGVLDESKFGILTEIQPIFTAHAANLFAVPPGDQKPALDVQQPTVPPELFPLFSNYRRLHHWDQDPFPEFAEGRLPLRTVTVSVPQPGPAGTSASAATATGAATLPAPPAAPAKKRTKGSRAASASSAAAGAGSTAAAAAATATAQPATMLRTALVPPEWIGPDVVTKCSLEGAESVRQCTRCFEFSDGRLSLADATEPVLPNVLPGAPPGSGFRGHPPWQGKFLSTCVCGGQWKLLN
ncbi:hypothetical protein HK405_000863 [Cladochytrium tenue]|nr:hypothetical protein HK405_000863 [Cladochytrium tenue]